MSVRVPDVLLRVGGRTLLRHGVLASAGAGRVEVPYTFARADASTCATYFDRDGILRLAAANITRIEWADLDGDGIRETPGISLEGTRTNVVLHNRDLTNAAWVKSGGGGVSAVKDQTGIDGVASSASRITATGANGTCLQAITLGSSQRLQSCYIKRLVGTGNIDMTTDNGSTWTTLTVTAAFTRVKIPAQTLANPTVGFRIVTSGDSVAIDFVQNETGAFESSPIATTTAAVGRAADILTLPFNFGPMDLTVLTRLARPVYADSGIDIGIPPRIWRLGTTTPVITLFFRQDARDVHLRVTPNDATDVLVGIPGGAELSILGQIKNLGTAPAAALDVGAGLSAFDTGSPVFAAFGNQIFSPTPVSGQELYGVLTDVLIARGLFTRAEMLAVP